MTNERKAAGKWWKVAGAVIGALVGLVVTANDDLFALLGLGNEMQFPYQLLGLLGWGYIGAAIGKAIGRRKHQGPRTQQDREA